MYQKDYILRLIEQAFRFLGQVLNLIKKGKLDEAADRLEDSYHDFLREDASFFTGIPENKLTETLLREHNYSNGHLEILAELFNVQAELDLAKGNKRECLEFSRKSLLLYQFVDKELKTYSSERLKRIDEIADRLKKLS